MNQQLQNILHLVIIAIILVLFYIFYPQHEYSPHGIYLPQSDQTYQSLPQNEVNQLTFQPNAQPIGMINVLVHFSSSDQTEIDSLIKKAISTTTELAAEHGANAFGPVQTFMSERQGPLDAIKLTTYTYHLN